MSDKINTDDILKNLVGKELSPEMLGKILNNDYISFPDRDVSAPSNISSSAESDSSCKPDNLTNLEKEENRKNDLISNVKDMETLVKTLEDMRDEFLKGMDIPPASPGIAKAAMLINGTPNITKETFDKAEAIVDIWEPINQGFVAPLIPLIEDARVVNAIKKCSDISKAAWDGLEFAQDVESEEDIDSEYGNTIAKSIADTTEEFENKMADIFLYIINKLFWNIIWTRIWTSVFKMIEKLIAVPIDTPIMILKGLFFRIPKLTKENYYKFGPIHRALNKFKLVILCKVPHAAWKDYEPEMGIKVFWNGLFKELVEICNDGQYNEDCLDKTYPAEHNSPLPPFLDKDSAEYKAGPFPRTKGDPDDEDEKSALASAFDDMDDPEDIDPCDLANEFGRAFEDMEMGEDTVSPACIDAANKVLKAAYDDAKYNNTSN